MDAGCPGSTRAATGAGAEPCPTKLIICASSGDRAPLCSELATNRVNTSNAALIEAAAVCARNIGGNAFVGLLLLHADTTSLTA